MGPGAALIVGIPFVVLTLALLVVFRRERLRREAGAGRPSRWFPLYGLLVLLILFVGYIAVGTVIAALNPPSGRH